MKRTLRPGRVGSLLVTPSARSRSLTAFVALAAERHRHFAERSALPFGIVSVIVALIGLGMMPILSSTGVIVMLVGCAGVGRSLYLRYAWEPLLWQEATVVRRQREVRAAVFRRLDHLRTSVGLEQSMEPDSLAHLESIASQWEVLDHMLQARSWSMQSELRDRIRRHAEDALEEAIILESGAGSEYGYAPQEAQSRVAEIEEAFHNVNQQVDQLARAIESYPRVNFDNNGAPVSGAFTQADALEEAMARLQPQLPQPPERP